MHNKSFKVLGCIVFVTGVLSGLAGCSSMPSQSIQTEEKAIESDVNATTAQNDTEGQKQEAERSLEAEGQKVGTEFELENVGRCTFAAGKEKASVQPDEVFVESTKIEWTASTAEGEYIFPCMRVNETGDMFMIDWTYDEYYFAIYGKSPQKTSDRDMAGKIALAIIYNLGGAE